MTELMKLPLRVGDEFTGTHRIFDAAGYEVAEVGMRLTSIDEDAELAADITRAVNASAAAERLAESVAVTLQAMDAQGWTDGALIAALAEYRRVAGEPS